MNIRFVIPFLIGLLSLQSVHAQSININMPEHDQKAYYFGITFGANFSTYRIKYNKSFVNTDTFNVIQPKYGPGFNLGLMANLRLSKFIDVRFIPSLAFADKPIFLNMTGADGSDSITTQNVEAIYMHLPFQLKFKSDRIKNFRFYGMAGVKFDFDLAANARSRRKDEFIKVSSFDYGYELGVGFEFYYPNFIFSPEVKLSQGLGNALSPDDRIPFSNAINGLSTRMFVISIHLEG